MCASNSANLISRDLITVIISDEESELWSGIRHVSACARAMEGKEHKENYAFPTQTLQNREVNNRIDFIIEWKQKNGHWREHDNVSILAGTTVSTTCGNLRNLETWTIRSLICYFYNSFLFSQLTLNAQMAAWYFCHSVTLQSIVNIVSTKCFDHTRLESSTSACCCMLMHCTEWSTIKN